jgi:hypothetical protein
MATLSITNRFLSYEDSISSNNPQQRPFDWSRQLQGIPCDNASAEPFRIQPLAQVTVFDGTRTLGYGALTQYDLAPVNIAANRYRLKWNGVGDAPTFRTDRAVDFLSGPNPATITVTPQLNQCVAVTSNAGAVFGSVVPGDVVYIPGLSTGDLASIFDPLNEGYWSVLNATASTLALVRMSGQVYTALAQTVTITDNTSFQVFSSDIVQLDDTLSLVTGFSPVLFQNYEIVAVTADSLDFISGTILPPLVDYAPGINSIVVFSNAKSWIALETDQNLDVSINGSSTSFTVEPLLAGDPAKVGVFQLMGTVYSLAVTNKSTVPASIRILSAE